MDKSYSTMPRDTKALVARDPRQVAELVLWLAGMVAGVLALGWPL